MKKWIKQAVCTMLCAALSMAAFTVPATAAYDDYEAITSHISLQVPGKLQITRPQGNIGTGEANFYITGTSNPQAELTVNGEAVQARGSQGSFGVYVSLEMGENTFTFVNGAAEETVAITRGSGIKVATTKTLSSMTPVYDVAVVSGKTATLTCVAPAGGRVTASVNGSTVAMKQKAQAQTGVPAVFTGEYTMPSVSGTENIGPVTYTLEYDGETSSAPSAGALYAVGKGDPLLVEMKDNATVVFAENSKQSSLVATAKGGAVDYVSEIGDNMYRLGMGGWIPQESAQPLTSHPGYRNKVSGVRFEQSGKGEAFIFEGTGKPVYSAMQNSEKLLITFAHTTGVDDVPSQDSALFSNVSIKESDGDTTLEFILSGNKRLWGYTVEYRGGETVLFCKYKPVLSGGAKPLGNVTVAVDAGHGGTDTGALGVAADAGPIEKQINYDTALAVKKRLESLGATVLMTRPKDEFVSLSGRMDAAEAEKADFFISLHCNSIGVNQNGLKPNGVEIYYYEDIAKPFASTLLNHIVSETDRASRGVKYGLYKVTLNSYAPAVLVEMGFLTNPSEYDSLCSRRGIFNMANAVGDAVVSALS